MKMRKRRIVGVARLTKMLNCLPKKDRKRDRLILHSRALELKEAIEIIARIKLSAWLALCKEPLIEGLQLRILAVEKLKISLQETRANDLREVNHLSNSLSSQLSPHSLKLVATKVITPSVRNMSQTTRLCPLKKEDQHLVIITAT